MSGRFRRSRPARRERARSSIPRPDRRPSFWAMPRSVRDDRPLGSGRFREQAQDQLAAVVKGQAGELGHQPAVVAVDREAGEAVALAEDEPVGRSLAA